MAMALTAARRIIANAIPTTRTADLSAYLERFGTFEPFAVSYRESIDIYNHVRAGLGLGPTNAILTSPKGNAKLAHTRTPVYSLSLSPGNSSGIEVCGQYRGACSFPCVGGFECGAAKRYGASHTMLPRMARGLYLAQYPRAAVSGIGHELERGTYRRNGRLVVGRRVISGRMNAFGDLRWEYIAPGLFTIPYVRGSYDYTKRPDRDPERVPGGRYRLIMSATETDTAETLAAKIAAGPLAIVVDVPRTFTYPETLAGFRVVNGDADDRENSRQDPGTIIALSLKGSRQAQEHARRTRFARSLEDWRDILARV